MISWLVSLLVTPVLNWLSDKLGSLLSRLWRWVQLKLRMRARENQAETIREIVEEIKRLLAEGKPVPEELKRRLDDENRKLLGS